MIVEVDVEVLVFAEITTSSSNTILGANPIASTVSKSLLETPSANTIDDPFVAVKSTFA